jgi:hypothetical protein
VATGLVRLAGLARPAVTIIIAVVRRIEAGDSFRRPTRTGRKVGWIVKSLVLALVLTGVCGVALAEERTVIVPRDDRPFTVDKDDLVRLTGKGIAGSKIEAKVDGPAKVEATATVREVANGQALLGGHVKEFDLKPTDSGKVTVTITVTPPQPGAKPIVRKYEFQVR